MKTHATCWDGYGQYLGVHFDGSIKGKVEELVATVVEVME